MKIHINGKETEIKDNITVTELLEELRFDPLKVVVEKNLVIIKKEDFNDNVLNEGDKIEILRFVGGG